VSSVWQEKVGNDKTVVWPAGVGGKGNEGVAAYVQRVQGSIGYVEFAYAVQNKLNTCAHQLRQQPRKNLRRNVLIGHAPAPSGLSGEQSLRR